MMVVSIGHNFFWLQISSPHVIVLNLFTESNSRWIVTLRPENVNLTVIACGLWLESIEKQVVKTIEE